MSEGLTEILESLIKKIDKTETDTKSLSLSPKERLLLEILDPTHNNISNKESSNLITQRISDSTKQRIKDYYTFYCFARNFENQNNINEFKQFTVKFPIKGKYTLTGEELLNNFSEFAKQLIKEYIDWLNQMLGFKYSEKYVFAVLKTQLTNDKYILPLIENPTVYHFRFWIGLQLLNRYCKTLFPASDYGEYEFVKTTQGKIRHFLPKKVHKRLLEEAQASIVELQEREPIAIDETLINNVISRIPSSDADVKDIFENVNFENEETKKLFNMIQQSESEWEHYSVKIRCKYNPKTKKMKVISEIPSVIQELEKRFVNKLKEIWQNRIKADNHFKSVKEVRNLMKLIREEYDTNFSVIRTDIKDFYYSINPKIIFSILNKLNIFTTRELRVLKYLIFNYYLVFDKEQRTEISKKVPTVKPKIGLLVGSSLSEWFARLLLKLIEQKIKEQHPDTLITFYMDDMLIIKESEKWQENLRTYKTLIDTLGIFGLQLSAQKTQFISTEKAEDIYKFCKELNIPEKFIPAVEEEVTYAGLTINDKLMISINREAIFDSLYKHTYAKLPTLDFFSAKIEDYDKEIVNQIVSGTAKRYKDILDIKPQKDYISDLLDGISSFLEFLVQEKLENKTEFKLLIDKYKSYFDIGDLTKTLTSDKRCPICTCPREWHEKFLCKHCAQHYYRENFRRHQKIVHLLEAKLKMKPLQPIPDEPEQDLEHHGHKWDITLVKNIQRLPYAKRAKFSKYNKGTVIAVTPFGVHLFSTGVEDCDKCKELNEKIYKMKNDIHNLAYEPDLYDTIFKNLERDYGLSSEEEEW